MESISHLPTEIPIEKIIKIEDSSLSKSSSQQIQPQRPSSASATATSSSNETQISTPHSATATATSSSNETQISPPPSATATSTSGSNESQISQDMENDLLKSVMNKDWDTVISMYKKHKTVIQTVQIPRANETALHAAISKGTDKVVMQLLAVIDPQKIGKMFNYSSENPLHLAAALGQAEICRQIVEKDVELIGMRNKDGETPLFLAALHGKKGAFYALHPTCPLNPSLYLKHDVMHCKRNDGNSILHVAILGEHYELAFHIINWYPELVKYHDEKGRTALHLLARTPSAFKSGCHYGVVEDFIYNCHDVIDLIEVEMPSNYKDERRLNNSIPVRENYRTCSDLLKTFINAMVCLASGGKKDNSEDAGKQLLPVQCTSKHQKQDIGAPNPRIEVGEQNNTCGRSHIKVVGKVAEGTSYESTPSLYPPNYKTFISFLLFALELLGLGFFRVHKVKEKKQKHKMTLQVMKSLVHHSKNWDYTAKATEPHPGVGSEPNVTSNQDTYEMKNIISEMKGKKIQVEVEEAQPDVYDLQLLDSQEGVEERSPFLISAMMGVTEIVKEILKEFPVAIYDQDKDGKNVLLLAADYKQPAVYNMVLKNFENPSLYGRIDKDGNGVLHLAAGRSKSQSWQVTGVASQMQCELKWYQFIHDNSLPWGLNNKGKSPKEIFIETHKDMAEKAQEWLTTTSNACSVVVTVIATVSYASVTDLKGEKNYSNMPLRNFFAIFTLLSIFSSVASLGVFLSILTSNFEMLDFLYNLPSKLISGLTLLFISVSAMLVSFSISHFFFVENELRITRFPIYSIVFFPITIFALALSPLYFNVIRSTFSEPRRRNETITLN